MTSKTIFLKGDNTRVNIDGLELTLGELKGHIINSETYMNYLRELGKK